MITLTYQNINGGVILERELKANELNFTSKKITATHCIFYYGDEPVPEPIVEIIPLNWKGLRINLFHSPLFLRALTEANQNVYSTLLKVITDGEISEASENTFLYIFNMLEMTFSSVEKEELNGYLTANNFTIRIV